MLVVEQFPLTRREAGRNEHHRIEGMVKAFARALRVAVERDPRTASSIPSTKGVL